MQQGGNWDSKIRFFSRFLGFDNDDDEAEDTNDSSLQSSLVRRSGKGMEITQSSPMYHSMILNNQHKYQTDRRWQSLILTAFVPSLKSELYKLCRENSYDVHKVLAWLDQNKCKINLRLYNLRRVQYLNYLIPNHSYKKDQPGPQLQKMFQSTHQNINSDLVGILLIQRSDLRFNQTLLHISQTVNEYLYDSPVIAFSLMYSICCSEVYVHILSLDIREIDSIILEVCKRIIINCSSSSFIRRDNVSLEEFVKEMLFSFWLNISDNRTLFREKIMYFLLANQLSLKSVSRVCEAAVVGLSRILNQGFKQKSIHALKNPRDILDEEVFTNYLLHQ